MYLERPKQNLLCLCPFQLPNTAFLSHEAYMFTKICVKNCSAKRHPNSLPMPLWREPFSGIAALHTWGRSLPVLPPPLAEQDSHRRILELACKGVAVTWLLPHEVTPAKAVATTHHLRKRLPVFSVQFAKAPFSVKAKFPEHIQRHFASARLFLCCQLQLVTPRSFGFRLLHFRATQK